MKILVVDNISKRFGSHQAVDKVSFEINQGEIVGFLGKNGAGKTTLMRMITSFLAPTTGKIWVDGDDISKHSLAIRQKIGYLPESPPLYPEMSVYQYLKFAAEIKEVPAKKLTVQIAKIIDECNLQEVAKKTISTLSKGYKQRVGIAQAIIHDPKLLILDEPTSGLDPIQIQQVLSLIKNQREQRTVLLSTHTLSEIEQVAKRILMIKSGKLVIDEPLDSLLQNYQGGSKMASDDHKLTKSTTLEQIFIDFHNTPAAPKSAMSDDQT